MSRFITNLVPKREKSTSTSGVFAAIKSLTWIQWAQFISGWLAWTCDAFDFFSVALSLEMLSEQFNKPTASITTAITLTLLFRSVGAITFGILSDRFGRRWPLTVNLLFCCSFSLATSFVQTFNQFLAIRSLFGVAMGGIWGLAASTSLENLPVELRGLGSGIVQQGYALGYLLAAIVNLTVVPHTSHKWRAMFWTGSSMLFSAAVLRALLPESAVFLRAKTMEREKGTDTSQKTKIFLRETKEMLKHHWLLCIYAILLMAGFNFLSHGSQDLYPTYLESAKGFSSHSATIATIIGTCGAITGGVIAGNTSQYLGRRLTIIVFILLVGAFIPLWILPASFSALAAGAFCVQFGVQGAWGVIPIQLAEMSPPAFRATFPGVAYQLGNMISAASAQIEATGGKNFETQVMINGKLQTVPGYAMVQGIFIGVVAAFVILITIVGPENHAAHFEQHKTAFEEGGGRGHAVTEDEDETGKRSVNDMDQESSKV
ncbi:carboxylic acid transporter protein [Butyriboletus roseoflavus]|nr:carboxylic acid transporter protein [Butyriboletus roseoflavus]KAG8215556.1 carboxylic acid transporter protein [Butyriboletus roseoflavus]